MTRRVFLDTEWTAPPWSDRSELMWIGLADEDMRSWYGISSEVVVDPATNAFVSGAFRLIDPGEPRLSRAQLAAAVIDFCGAVDEFWVWIPTLESFSAWSGLADKAAESYARCRDVDLRMLRALLNPGLQVGQTTCTISMRQRQRQGSKSRRERRTTFTRVSTSSGIASCTDLSMRRPVRGQLNSNARRTAVAPACPFNRRQEAWSSRRNSSLARKAPTSMPFQLSNVTSLRPRISSAAPTSRAR